MRHDPHFAFKGLGVALITPFTPDGQIDFTRLAELVDRVIGNGVDYLLALGTTSEYPTIAPPEKDDVLRCILESAAFPTRERSISSGVSTRLLRNKKD